MTRYLCMVAVLGVVAVPDWATACRPLWGGSVVYSQPVYHSYPTYPVCVPPPVYACPPIYPEYAYPPPSAPALPPPRIETIPRTAIPEPAPGSGLGSRPGIRPPVVEPVRPAAGMTLPAAPTAPKPDKVDPPAVVPDPSPLPKFPEVKIPKELGPLPKLDPPAKTDPKPKEKEPEFRPIPVPAAKGMDPLPTLELPKTDAPKVMPVAPPEPAPAPSLPDGKLPPLELPKEVAPKAAPAPAAPTTGAAIPSAAPPIPDPLIPPIDVPLIPDPKKDGLPSLTLPPDTPVGGTTAKSSPLTGARREMTVSVFAASGEKVVGPGYRTVGFFNHTARDLDLTIEGRAVKLPAKSYLHAQLAPTFTWNHGGGQAVRETVPAGAAGVDVVFRE